jgi:hypothetical protein
MLAETEAQPPDGPLAIISKAVELKELPIELLKELRAMWQEEKADIKEKAYNTAMAAFQAECPVIKKTKRVNFNEVHYSYAPLDIIVAQIRVPLERHGFSYMIKTEQTVDSVTAICIAKHSDGHKESSKLTVPIETKAKMNAAQKTASALTYAKRYALCDVFGILTGDDDDDARGSDPAHAAGEHPASKHKRSSKPRDDRPTPPPCPKCKHQTTVIYSKWPKPGGWFYCNECKKQFGDEPGVITAPTEKSSPLADDVPADAFDGPSDNENAPQEPPGATRTRTPEEVDTGHQQEPELASTAQVTALQTLRKKCGISDAAYHRDLEKQYGVKSTKKLTKAQASETHDVLQTMLKQKEAAETAKRQDADKIPDYIPNSDEHDERLGDS